MSRVQRHGLWKDAEDVELDMAKAERDVASRPPSPSLEPALFALPEPISPDSVSLSNEHADGALHETHSFHSNKLTVGAHSKRRQSLG